MGVSWVAKAIIGVPLFEEKLYKKSIKVKAFDHDRPESMSFCPDTGKQLWKELEQTIPEFNDIENTVCGYPILGDEEMGKYIALPGLHVNDGPSNHRGSGHELVKLSDDLKSLREKMRDDLGPLGLWVEKKFGMHCIIVGYA